MTHRFLGTRRFPAVPSVLARLRPTRCKEVPKDREENYGDMSLPVMMTRL